MNDDCVFLILERLEFVDLLNMAEINDQFSMLAAVVFRRKFSYLEILYEKDYSNSESKASKAQIKIKDSELISNAFKHFGHSIKKFTSIIYDSIKPLQAKLIGQLISNYSSESLTDIEIGYHSAILLEYITKPLINVKYVLFEGNLMNSNAQTIRAKELFPAVRHLNFFSLSDSGLAYFDYHAPNLEQLSIYGFPSRRDSPFPGVITKNPQIRCIDLDTDEPDFVRRMNAQLPQLEILTLARFTLQHESIRFENVTTFRTGSFGSSPKNLLFPRLEKLAIDMKNYNSQKFHEFLTFLNEHNHLSHLYLYVYKVDDFTEFQKLTANLTNLVEITLMNDQRETDSVSSEIIVDFLRSHDKMQKLNCVNFSKDRQGELRKRLKNEWNTKTIDNGLSFVRY